MRYKKLIDRFLSQRSSQSNAQVAVALVAGLAAGAVISILLAPSKGSATRKSIADGAKNLRDSYTSFKDRILGRDAIEEVVETPEVPHFKHTVTKKRKSAIKDLISEAHHTDSHIAQN